MRGIIYLIAISVISIMYSCSTLPPEQVKVEQGIVQGYIEDGLRIFKGIPFAAPPVGELRWKAPQPAEKWEGVKQTTEFAPASVQFVNQPYGINEDCLYLNVWTPAKSSNEKLAVLVWIHGGGFSIGSTGEALSDCKALAHKDVVVVSIAYRLGQLGFLAHPELSAESPDGVSGNYGLLDQIAALRWIKNNIGAFGGDPEKVTICGESAGGYAVSMLCASPLAKRLFSGAISQSGGSFGPLKTLKQAETDGKSFTQNAGASSIKELREMDAEKLPMGWYVGNAWPIIDKHVILDDQYKLYEAGKYNDIPVLIGYNSDDGEMFMRTHNPKEYIASVEEQYEKFADTLLKVYPLADNTIPKTARDLVRDAMFGWHTWSWARLQAQTGKTKVFYYYFDQHPDYPEDSPRYGYGSLHGQEFGYVFMHIDTVKEEMTKYDVELSEIMATYWTNFAKKGNPNREELPAWPAFSNENPNVMYLTNPTPHVGPVPNAKALEVLDDYFEWRRNTAE